MTNVDYSLYLVTDSSKAILGDRDIVSVVAAAIEGGVTVVQLREKDLDSAEFIRVAKELHSITQRHNIPLLINDRVDIALAIDAEGVHIGQDDMDLKTARKLLGKGKIIGVTVSSAEEAIQAAESGADYLGIGTVFATPTKEDSSHIIGPAGVRAILESLAARGLDTPTVCIGGINSSNLQRVLYQSQTPGKKLDGVAVVSAIMGGPEPKDSAASLLRLFSKPPLFASQRESTSQARDIIGSVPRVLQRLVETKPLCHNITNLVVQNFSANIALAAGGSPIMSDNGQEMGDLAKLGGSLVINMGTVTPQSLANYVAGLQAYNACGNPVLFDPVGAGATAVRRNAVGKLLAAGYFDIIKGNESEILTVVGDRSDIVQHGVDTASGSGLSETDKAKVVKNLAARERNVVLMTGKIDYLSDGSRTYAISNGHYYLGEITGSGCALGTTIAAFAAIERKDMLLAVLSGVLMYEIAAENAAKRDDVKGPGTFVPALLDELYKIRKAASNRQECSLPKLAKVEEVKSL